MGLLTSFTRPTAVDPLDTLDLRDDFLGGGSAATGSIGELGWIFANGTFTVTNGSASHPGVYRRDTSTSTSQTAYARLTSNFLASEFFDVTWVFRLNTNDADTRVRLGLSSDWTSDTPVSAVYVEKVLADTSWFGTARAASTESRTAALQAVDTSYHKARIRRIDASTVGFTLDALAEVTLATNVPGAVTVNPGIQIFNNTAASKTIDLDYFRLRLTGLVR